MPSVMDTIRFREAYNKLGSGKRNTFVRETFAWLDLEVKPRLDAEELEVLKGFMNELQKTTVTETIDEAWYTNFFRNYSRYWYM